MGCKIKSNSPPPPYDIGGGGAFKQLAFVTSIKFTLNMLRLWYEGEVVERNGGQTLGVLGSLMEEYDLR